MNNEENAMMNEMTVDTENRIPTSDEINTVNQAGMDELNDESVQGNEGQPTKKRISTKKLIIIIAICIAVIAAGVGGYLYYDANKLTDSEKVAVDKVNSMIEKLPDNIQLSNEVAVEMAIDSFSKLNDKQKRKVDNYEKVEEAKAKIDSLKVEEVDETIKSIGNITLDSGGIILKAEKLYDGLSTELKERVTQHDVLVSARKEHDNLTSKQVIDMIDALGEITLDSNGKINEIDTYYNRLSGTAKALVNNYSILSSAKQRYAELKKEAAEKAYKDAISKLKQDKDEIQGQMWYMPKNAPAYWNSRTYFYPYLTANISNGRISGMRVQTSYVARDWIFWTTLIINVDGENYYKTFSYNDITRETYLGGICEVGDYYCTSSDIDVLRKIAASEKTTIRFQGDTYRKDYVLDQRDRTSIIQILAAYDASNEFFG